MANTTRFELSRLEGCTGTISESNVAVPHALHPATSPRDDDRDARARDGAQPQRPTTTRPPDAPVVPANAQKVAASLVAAHVTDPEISPAIAAALPRTSNRVTTLIPQNSLLGAAAAVTACASATVEQDDRERLPIGVIVALTLAAWIPVLLLWSMRLG